jgi:hypothetical protein
MPPRPTPRQLELLEEIRALLEVELPVSEVESTTHWKHYEDEELGFSPLGESAGFRVVGPHFPIHVGTPVPWETDPTGRVQVTLSDPPRRPKQDASGVELTDEARRRLEELGFIDRVGYLRASWPLSERARQIAATVLDAARVPVRTVR